MIPADSKLMTYEQAGKLIPTKNGKGKGVRFIRNAIKRGDLIGTDLGKNAKFVSELNFLKYLKAHETLENRH